MHKFILIAILILFVGLGYIGYQQLSAPAPDTDPGFAPPPAVDVVPAPLEETPPPDLGPYTARLSAGGFVAVDDIVEYPGAEVLADGVYQISDSLDEYTIYYNQYSSVIFIHLYATPLGLMRQQAERKLKEILPLQDSEICEIDIAVTTNPFVDQEFSGRNLGLTFCPNAVPLPIR